MNLTPFEKFQQAFQKPAANSANALRAGLPAQDITTHADRIRVESPDATRQEYDPMIHPADWAACITPDSTAVPDGMLHAIVDLFELHVPVPVYGLCDRQHSDCYPVRIEPIAATMDWTVITPVMRLPIPTCTKSRRGYICRECANLPASTQSVHHADKKLRPRRRHTDPYDICQVSRVLGPWAALAADILGRDLPVWVDIPPKAVRPAKEPQA